MHKQLLKRKYERTKPDNGAYSGKIQIICVILDFARVKGKVCNSQEVKMCLTESLRKDRKKNFSY